MADLFKFFGIKTSNDAAPKQDDLPIAHVIVDCVNVRDAFLHFNERIMHEMVNTYNVVKYKTAVSYVVAMGTESIDFVDALQIADIIEQQDYSLRIVLTRHDAALAEMTLTHRIGTIASEVRHNDYIFIICRSDEVIEACVAGGQYTIPMKRLPPYVPHEYLPPTYESLYAPTEVAHDPQGEVQEVEREKEIGCL
jgi:hypothetical protein